MLNLFLAFGNVLLTVLLPIAVLTYFFIKKPKNAKIMLLGAATFLIFQLLTRMPLLQLLNAYAWWNSFAYGRPVLHYLLLAFTAGVFEECGRYIVMRLFMKKTLSRKDGIVFGLGHGMFEAAMITGVGYLVIMFTNMDMLSSMPPAGIIFGSVERISAVIVHIGLSMWVVQAVRLAKPLRVLVAIALHGLLNCIPLLVKNNMALTEALLLIAAVLMFFVMWFATKEKKEVLA